MTGQLIITAPAFQSPPLLCIHFGLKEEHEEGAEIIVNPCFDAPSPLPRCCLNMSLFCPPHFLFQPESLSLICKCCRPHPPTPPPRKLFWIAAGNQHRCHPAAISLLLTLFMCVVAVCMRV